MKRLAGLVLLASAAAGCGGGGGGPASPSATPTPAPTVGPAGGTVTAAGARLVVPAGSLNATVALSLRAATGAPLDPAVVTGSALQVEPGATVFATPATLAIGLSAGRGPLGADRAEMALHVLRAGAWEPVADSRVDLGADEVQAPIREAGVYAVRWTGPPEGCATGAHRQFDFWLGEWNLVVPSGIAGPNDITRDGCILLEHFREVSGTVGRSVSFYRERDGAWYQTYIDSRGNRLELRGAFVEGRMVLRAAGGAAIWEPLAADRVRFQQTDTTGAVTFDSTYVRR